VPATHIGHVILHLTCMRRYNLIITRTDGPNENEIFEMFMKNLWIEIKGIISLMSHCN
jgi:hypothetical protein